MALAVRRDPGMQVAEDRAWVEDRPDEERWQLIDGTLAVADLYDDIGF
ncbi:hypothetical protein [Methylobacterium organophilum]|uniref:Uncharacterized protein n=1 Tax=Methylobacterium organophilum TaxID=410 RepID=A0ABQ4T129_METOR|nr:hypothetical protein LKMONMHP_0171 [Methylobacterium organophilum]